MSAVTCPFCGSDHPEGTFVCPNTNRRLQGLLPTGTSIEGKYRIEGIIGVGGMGVVYRAEQTKINRLVALKMLLPEYTVYPDLVARVEREARTAGQIDHPNVVTITDLGVTTEFGPYIAMELLRGQELATVVENAGGRLDPAEAVDVIRQVLAGLEAAHKRGVIHRDLKPQNIFLSTDDEGRRRVTVLDFGISKLRDDKELNSLSRTGTVMGTPRFMAPEQAAGARDQDARIDLYATGAVLYAVLCNGLPYEAENYNLLISEILNKAPIQILQRNASLDPRLASIVMKSIAKKPESRYQSAREMADALSYWYEHRNAPMPATAPRSSTSRNSGMLSTDTPVFDLRRGVPRPPSPSAPELSRDNPEYLGRDEATVMVPVPLRGEENSAAGPPDEFFDDDNAPRTIRDVGAPTRPSPPPGRPPRSPPPPADGRVSVPETSALLDSPLDLLLHELTGPMSRPEQEWSSRPGLFSLDYPFDAPLDARIGEVSTGTDQVGNSSDYHVPRNSGLLGGSAPPMRDQLQVTDPGIPSKTILVLHRLHAIATTRPGQLEMLKGATRLSIDAEFERAAPSSHLMRLSSALEAVMVIEATLIDRLVSARPRAAWLDRLKGEGTNRFVGYSVGQLRKFFADGAYPSLMTMGGMLHGKWRLVPAVLAEDLQRLLGIPTGLEKDVYVAGSLRNVLAHRADYARDPERHLGPCLGRITRTGPPGAIQLDAPPETFEWLEWLCVSILERKARHRIDAPPPR